MKPAGPVNIWIAIVSLITSMLLFMIALPGWMAKPVRSLRVPLTYDSLPADFYVVKAPDYITVQVAADQAEFQSISDKPKATANLSDAQPGAHIYSVSLQPPGLVRAAVTTNLQANFTLEKSKPKSNIPVFVVTSGKLSNPTLVVDKLVSDTRTVTIEGRARDMAQVDHVRATYHLDSAEGASGQPQGSPLDAVDSRDQVVPGVNVKPASVLIRAQLVLAPQTKQAFVDIQFAKSQIPSGYVVKNYSSDPTYVTVSGSSMALSRIARVSTDSIDLSATTQTQTFNIRLKPIDNVKIDPPMVQVTVEMEPISLKGLNGQTSPNSTGGASKTTKPSRTR